MNEFKVAQIKFVKSLINVLQSWYRRPKEKKKNLYINPRIESQLFSAA